MGPIKVLESKKNHGQLGIVAGRLYGLEDVNPGMVYTHRCENALNNGSDSNLLQVCELVMLFFEEESAACHKGSRRRGLSRQNLRWSA